MPDIPLTDPDRENPNEYSEVEYPMLTQLAGMGWDYLQGDLDYPQKTFREHFREVILKPRLRAAIRKINPVRGTGVPPVETWARRPCHGRRLFRLTT